MANIREAKKGKRPVTRSCTIPGDDGLVDEYRQLERSLLIDRKAAERSNERKIQLKVKETEAKLEALQAEIEAHEITFVFEAMGREAYSDLIGDHPPREDDTKNGLQFNADTFPPALLAASCVQPEGMDLKEATDIWENWSDGECELLLDTAVAANRTLRTVSFMRPAISGTGSSERNLSIAPDEESRMEVS